MGKAWQTAGLVRPGFPGAGPIHIFLSGKVPRTVGRPGGRLFRSGERRVGEGGRIRGAAGHLKKKKKRKKKKKKKRKRPQEKKREAIPITTTFVEIYIVLSLSSSRPSSILRY